MPAAARPAAALSLARAFQLLTESLLELGGTASDDQLRVRMVALHGREDPLLEAPRFARLLRQANDAEIADVRKVGDDTYEISVTRRAGMPTPPAAPREAVPARENGAAAPEAPADDSRAATAAQQRMGVRFRRGSRAPARPSDLPLVGVVNMEPAVTAAAQPVTAAVETAPAGAEAPAKRARRGGARKPKAAAAAPADNAPPPSEKPKAKTARKPARPRAKKSAE
jgi:hypothetical protein